MAQMTRIRLPKKIRFLLEINTLYSYIFHRGVVKLRSMFKLKPLYPYEENYRFDAETEGILKAIQKEIAPHERGDNPAFNKNWKSIHEREEIAQRVGSRIKNIIGEVKIDADDAALNSIQNVGYAVLGSQKLSTSAVDELVAFLDQQKVYPAHVAHFATQKPGTKDEVKQKGEPFGSYDVATILKAPHMAKILSDKNVTGMIAKYFGCLPTISSVNLFWSFVSTDGKPKGPQRFHRDVDDAKTCTMFINLTDTLPDEGAHCYVEKSSTYERLKGIFNDSKNDDLPSDLNPSQKRLGPEDFFTLPLNGYSFDKLYNHFFSANMVNLYGERGTVIVTDNYGIHRGVPPKQKDRLILWVSYALTSTHTQSAEVKLQKRVPYSQVKDRIENNKINRYVLRNIVNFNE